MVVLSHMLLSFQHSPQAFHEVKSLLCLLNLWGVYTTLSVFWVSKQKIYIIDRYFTSKRYFSQHSVASMLISRKGYNWSNVLSPNWCQAYRWVGL